MSFDRAAAVWPEVASAIGKNLMSIFNAGVPAQFHQVRSLGQETVWIHSVDES